MWSEISAVKSPKIKKTSIFFHYKLISSDDILKKITYLHPRHHKSFSFLIHSNLLENTKASIKTLYWFTLTMIYKIENQKVINVSPICGTRVDKVIALKWMTNGIRCTGPRAQILGTGLSGVAGWGDPHSNGPGCDAILIRQTPQ